MSCYLGLSKRNDEYYTPAYAVKALLPYIKEKSTIWCPFDKQWSEFVKILTEHNHKVIFSHIDEEKTFFIMSHKNLMTTSFQTLHFLRKERFYKD